MKKCYALILAMLLLVCGCTENQNPEETDTSAISSENLAASIALTYHTAAWSDPIDTSDPLFLWQTIGWYTVYDARLSGTDNIQITPDEADEIRQILAPDSSEIPMPENFPYGSVSQDGYTFEGTKMYFDNYMGVIAELNVHPGDALTYTVNIVDHYSAETVDAEYLITFSGNADSYKLDSMNTVRIDSAPVSHDTESESANFDVLNFTYDNLRECNQVETLLGYGKTIRITSEYEEAVFTTYVAHIPDSSDIIIWYSDGTGGYIKNYSFYTAEERVHVIPMSDSGSWLEGYVSDSNFDSLTKMEYVSEDGDNITFRYKYDSYSRSITVDRGSLAIRSNRMIDTSGKDMGTLRYEYGDFEAESPLTADWKGDFRTVTLKIREASSENEEWNTETYSLPVSWELDPSGYCPWGEAYLDENLSEKYTFPGGNEDYTVYITDSKG